MKLLIRRPAPAFAALAILFQFVPTLSAQSDDRVPAGVLAARNAEGEPIFLPLKKTDVTLDVTSGLVHAEVSQQFTNETNVPLEAVYVFPLPSQATVTNMELRIGDRIIRSVVQERVEAQKTYETAKAEGKRAALLEQERPNIFTTSVANFLPGETVRIHIEYLQPAEYQRGVYSVTFPTVVGPRYLPVSIPVPNADRITPPLAHPSFDTGHRLSLLANIHGLPVRAITSNTHAIDVTQADGGYRVVLRSGETMPDADFNLKIALDETSSTDARVVTSEGNPQDNLHALLTLFPPLAPEQVERIPRDVLFLIDTSGSMSGESIGQAKAGLTQCLAMLKAEDQFTIVRFSDSFSFFSPDLRPATPDRLEAARAYIGALQADGGTEMQKALEYTLSIAGRPDAMRLVVFLTDGDVGNEESLLRLLHERLGATRLFTFGIGSAPNEFLVRRMAELGRAQSRFITSQEDVGHVMSDLFKTLDSPVMTDVRVEWKDADGGPVETAKSFPNPCPDVYLDRPLQVAAELPAGFAGAARVSGLVNGKRVTTEYPIAKAEGGSHPAIPLLFAREQINQLLFLRLTSRNAAEQDRLRARVVELALRYQLLTEFTSRVAVEEKVTVAEDGSLVTTRVPTMLPRGWNPAAFFATGTDDPARILAGLTLILLGLGAAASSRRLERRAAWMPPLPVKANPSLLG